MQNLEFSSHLQYGICVSDLRVLTQEHIWPVLETKAGPSVRDRQLLVRTSNFINISLQIDVWISQNSDQDRQLFQLSPEHCIWQSSGIMICSPLQVSMMTDLTL